MAVENESGVGRRKSLLPSFSVNALKIAGAILLTLYFFSAAVLQNGVLHVNSYTPAQLNELLAGDAQAMLWASIASMAEVIGMMGISVYAYLLVQGVEHTSSMGRYALSVLICAIISEVPYDLAVYGQVWNWESQNPLWAVLVALISLWLMKYVEGRGTASYVMGAVAAIGGCLWAVLINCKFGWGFVLIASVLYLLRKWRILSLAAGLGASLVYVTAAMGFILISLCNGERREDESRVSKYAYYVYYPVMLLLMALWVKMQPAAL